MAYRSRSLGGTTQKPVVGQTPPAIRGEVQAQTTLGLDAAACPASTLVPGNWFGPKHPDLGRQDALVWDDWSAFCPVGEAVWLAPPVGRTKTLKAFLERAVATALQGREVWALLPAATGSRWFHTYVVAPNAHLRFYPSSAHAGVPRQPGPFANFPLVLATYPAGD